MSFARLHRVNIFAIIRKLFSELVGLLRRTCDISLYREVYMRPVRMWSRYLIGCSHTRLQDITVSARCDEQQCTGREFMVHFCALQYDGYVAELESLPKRDFWKRFGLLQHCECGAG